MRNYAFIFLLLFFTNCNDDRNIPDVSGIRVELEVERFEPGFFGMDTNRVQEGLQALETKHPAFYPIFMQRIIGVSGEPSDTTTIQVTRAVIGGYKLIYDTVYGKYRNLDWLEGDLEEGFRFVKHYFPGYKVPGIITYVAPFDVAGITLAPAHIGIGLQQFGGRDLFAYHTEQIMQLYPAYISRRFDREYIAPGVFNAVSQDIYPEQSNGKPLIEQIIEKGKRWWLMSHFLPRAADTLITGYTSNQQDWVEENEGLIWNYIITNENLYSIEPVVIQNYLGDAPFTQGMPGASPGNIGPWVGWQILKEFAEKNTELSPEQILRTPAIKIFEGAKYKPK